VAGGSQCAVAEYVQGRPKWIVLDGKGLLGPDAGQNGFHGSAERKMKHFRDFVKTGKLDLQKGPWCRQILRTDLDGVLQSGGTSGKVKPLGQDNPKNASVGCLLVALAADSAVTARPVGTLWPGCGWALRLLSGRCRLFWRSLCAPRIARRWAGPGCGPRMRSPRSCQRGERVPEPA